MKLIASLLLLLTASACNNSQDNSSSLVASASTELPAKAEKPAVVIPEIKTGLEGFYTGPFVAVEIKENSEVFDNRITIAIDSVVNGQLHGRSIVAGNERVFSGKMVKEGNHYEVDAPEPGDHKYDGRFRFTLYPEDKTIKGSWVANDSKLAVTKRDYELKLRTYKYDPDKNLPEDVVGMMMHGTYSENSEKAEAITKDALKKNASREILKSSDVENMYKADLELMRNAIYARHGYSFKNVRMRLLFDNYVDWYMPVSTNVSSLLTELEKKNIALIKRYEAHAPKYYDVFGR